jgi:cation:H+ antiporter
MIYALVFLASGIAVVLAGVALARHADAIAEATGLGRIWIGSVLLAGATSLPELTTDVVAVRLGAVDLAVGDLFGSSMANMLVLALVDLMPPRQQVLRRATIDHALAATLALSLNAVATLLVLLRPTTSVAWVGPGSLLLFLGYLLGTRAVYRHASRDRSRDPRTATAASGSPVSVRRAGIGFAAAALAVCAAAPAFAWSATGIAEVSGLGNTFVGTWLVGLATSLPELVASIAAVRMGAFDLAVGNLFGSNAFNMAVFLALDAVQPGSLFAIVDPNHAVSGVFAMLLTTLGLAAIVYRADRRFAMIEPDSLLMLIVYATAIGLLYMRSVN